MVERIKVIMKVVKKDLLRGKTNSNVRGRVKGAWRMNGRRERKRSYDEEACCFLTALVVKATPQVWQP